MSEPEPNPTPPTMRGRKRPPVAARNSISAQLRELLAQRDGSLYRLAKDADVDHKALERFVSGERGLTLATLDRLGVALDLQIGMRFARPSRGKVAPGKKPGRKS